MRFSSRFPLFIFLTFFITNCFAQTQIFTSQAQIDNSTSGGAIIGSVVINDDGDGMIDIDNLDGLIAITGVSEDLDIYGNPLLIDLDGLQGIQSIGGALHINKNNALTSLQGIENLESITQSLEIEYNPALTNISAMSNITTLVLALIINDNDALTNLNGLNAITDANAVFISENDNLIDLSGLGGLTNVIANIEISFNNSLEFLDGMSGLTGTNNFYIIGNPSLMSINGLTALTNVSFSFVIVNNPMLCGCNIVLEVTTGFPPTISNNSPGCNSYQEIMQMLGCCPSFTILSTNPQPTMITYNWQGPPPGTIYEIRYRIGNCGNDWTTIQNHPSNTYVLLNPVPCAAYDFQMRYFCEATGEWIGWVGNSSNSNCDNLSGRITTEQECGTEPIPFVDVLMLNPPFTLCTDETDNNGEYDCNIGTPGIVQVNPTRDGDDLCGVSTYDLVLLSKHILGIELIGSPYKRIAADVYLDGNLTTFDMVEIRKLILFKISAFNYVDSWEFADPFSIVDNDPEHVPDFADFLYFDSIEESLCDGGNMIGIKMGDLNCSANNCIYDDPGFTNGTVSEFVFGNPTSSKVNNQVSLPLIINDNDFEAAGFQMGFSWDPKMLQVIGIRGGKNVAFNESNYNVSKDGSAFISWNAEDAQGLQLANGKTLIFLDIETKGNIRDISQAISLDEKVMNSQIINNQLEVKKGVIATENMAKSRSFEQETARIQIYPTITQDFITVINDSGFEHQIQIYNTLGVLVLERYLESQAQSTIDLSFLKTGTYFLKSINQQSNSASTHKVIKIGE